MDYGSSTDPLSFVRALYGVSSRYRPLTGRTASSIGCPKSGSRAAFTRAHPGLFDATGWAHHPYDFVHAPSFNRRDPNSASLSGIAHLEHGLDHTFRAYHRAAGIPIYITEWGVQSRGPNPFIKFSQTQQAEYLNQGEYMAFRNPRVRSFAQFLLVDDAPNTQDPIGSRAYWSTFDSGLLLYGSTGPSRPTTPSNFRSGCPTPAMASTSTSGLRFAPRPRPASPSCSSSPGARGHGATSKRSPGAAPKVT